MRIDGDGRPICELTILLKPKEARDVIRVLEQLLAVVPAERAIAENEIDDAPSESEGGERIVRLVVYADGVETERRHDAEFGAA